MRGLMLLLHFAEVMSKEQRIVINRADDAGVLVCGVEE